MYCQHCGAQLSGSASFCSRCGSAVSHSTGYGYIRKNKWVAFFLCLLLGFFGAHRFYVGKTGTGILWLLTGGLLGVGWLFDLLGILFGGFRDKAGQPLG